MENSIEWFNDQHLCSPKQCECHACIKKYDLKGPGGCLPLSSQKMILCEHCGNKRCPHASDHNLQCTESNESGQPGSIYGR